MRIETLRQRLRALGANPRHEQRVLRLWSQALPQTAGKRQVEHFLPAPLVAELPAISEELAALARLESEHPGEDGSARLLVRLGDGQLVESVLLPRDGVCVSTQVGCAVGCTFCMTGTTGLIRQVGSAEIVAQVALARTKRPVKKVVFMGMGEPAHNLDNVMEAIELLGTAGQHRPQEPGVLHRGRPARVRDPAARPGQARAGAVAAHHPADLREQLLPRAPRLTPEELVDAGEAYARATGYPIQYQWTLLDGINDGDDEIEGIVRLLSGKYAILNMIPYNTVEGMPYRPSWEKAADIARRLHRRGILTKLRQSAGQDVDGGCGQLRARAEKPARPARRVIPVAPA
jgi:23S rRNA (adenine2503-C2)-methyltransferase